MLSDMHEKNYSFFKAHLQEYLGNPLIAGKIGVFHNESLVRIFDTFESAEKFAFSEELEDFVLQEIVDETKFVNYNKFLVGAYD